MTRVDSHRMTYGQNSEASKRAMELHGGIEFRGRTQPVQKSQGRLVSGNGKHPSWLEQREVKERNWEANRNQVVRDFIGCGENLSISFEGNGSHCRILSREAQVKL